MQPPLQLDLRGLRARPRYQSAGHRRGDVRVAGQQRLAGHRALARHDPVVRAGGLQRRGPAPRAPPRAASTRPSASPRPRARSGSVTTGIALRVARLEPRRLLGADLRIRSARYSSASMLVEKPSAISLPIASESAGVHGSGSMRSSWSSRGRARERVDRGVDPGRVRVSSSASRSGIVLGLALGPPPEAERAHQPVDLQALLAGELGHAAGARRAGRTRAARAGPARARSPARRQRSVRERATSRAARRSGRGRSDRPRVPGPASSRGLGQRPAQQRHHAAAVPAAARAPASAAPDPRLAIGGECQE